MRPIPDEKRQVLIARYHAGEKLAVLASELNLRYHSLKSNFRRWGVKMRSRAQRAASVNTDAFAGLDTQEKAYWLGFLMADGCITRQVRQVRKGRQAVLKVGLASRDRGHLEKLREFLAYEGNISHRVTNLGHPADDLSITSEQLCKNLEVLGCAQRKTFHMLPPSIAPELLRHWVRGFFDGDGYIYRSHKVLHHYSYSVGFCGLPNILEFIQGWALSIGVPAAKLAGYSHTSVISRMTWGSHEAIARLAFALYDGATVSLDRKKSLFLEALR